MGKRLAGESQGVIKSFRIIPQPLRLILISGQMNNRKELIGNYNLNFLPGGGGDWSWWGHSGEGCKANDHCSRLFFFFFVKVFFWPFLKVQLKIWQETGGERGGVTRSKGTRAGSRTQVHCRALPTELNGAPKTVFFLTFVYAKPLDFLNKTAAFQRLKAWHHWVLLRRHPDKQDLFLTLTSVGFVPKSNQNISRTT